MNKQPFKIFGETEEERSRVSTILSGDLPELDMEYCEESGKRWGNHSVTSEDKVEMKAENIELAGRFINFFRRKRA